MRKWLFISLAVLFFLAGAGVVATLFYLRKTFPPEKIQQELEAQLSRRSGFAVAIAGLDFTWSGRVKIGSICARNAEMKSERCFVRAENITLEVGLLPLLSKKLEIRAVRVATLAIHLFEEASVAKGGLKTVLHSWDTKKTAVAEPVQGSDTSAFSFGEVAVEKGELVRDVVLPPLPAGHTRFVFSYRAGGPALLESTVFFAQQGEAKLTLTTETNNFAANLLQLARKRQWSSDSALTGNLQCKGCPLDALDTRFRTLTGNVQLNLQGSNLLLESKDTVLSLSSPISGEFQTTAKLPVQLADLSLLNADVTLAKPGLSLSLNKLTRQPATGLSADFALSAELSALGAGAGISGHLNGGGQLRQSIPAGAFTVTGFSYPVRSKLVVSSARFNAALAGETISVKGQAFKLNESAFTASLNILRSAAGTKLSGAVDFPLLDITALTASDGDTNSASGAASTSSSSVTLRLSVGELRTGKWKIAQFRGDFAQNATAMQLENAGGIVAGGRLQFSYRRPGQGAQSLRLQAQGLKAQTISENLSLPGTVYGTLNTSANLQFTGSSTESIRRSLTGSLNADLGRGKIKNSFLQKGILTGPLHKLEDKFSDIEFASGSIEARFSAGAIEIKKLWFDAEEWNAQLRAEADAEGQGKAALNFRFRSSFVENAANPLHLGIGSRKEGDFYDLPFACRGNVFSGACYKQNW